MEDQRGILTIDISLIISMIITEEHGKTIDIIFIDAKQQRRQSGLKPGGRGPGSKNFVFLEKFPKNLDSFRQCHKQTK